MESFEELGVAPELAEALAAEGIEEPTDFQEDALPVLLRGNALLAQAGPGAGTLLAYGIPLLQRVDPEANSLRGLVLTPTLDRADGLARALSRMAVITGHRIAALGAPWALPEMASILFATPGDMLRELKRSEASLEELEAVVVDGFSAMGPEAHEALEALLETAPREGLRVLLSLPFTEEAEAFGKAHFHRPVHLPPKAAGDTAKDSVPHRGEVHYHLTEEEKGDAVLKSVAGALERGAHHVLLFTLTEDQAADLGDFLALHGFMAGPPGDETAPVWLSARALDARKVLEEWPDSAPVQTLSVDAPSSADVLDRRHGGGQPGVILLRPREMPHLKEAARQAGYKLIPAKEPPPSRVADELERLTDLLRRTAKEENLAPYFLALEPLFQDHAPGEVAAAALALLKEKKAASLETPSAGKSGDEGARSSGGPAPRTWVRLFVGVGEKEDIRPGDLLGAISGEAGVEGSQVGKIEIRETFSLVEVESQAAERVIKGLNGTTIKGRSVRADYDRGGPKGRSPRRPRGGGGPRRS